MSDNRNSSHIEIKGDEVDLVFNGDGGARGPDLKRRLRATPSGDGQVKVSLVGQRGGSYGAEITVSAADLKDWAKIAEMKNSQED